MEMSTVFGVCYFLLSTILIFPLFGSSARITDFILLKNKTCEKTQKKFAMAMHDFVSCSIVSARPITFCEDCVSWYLDVLTTHQDILTVVDNGTNCRNQLINADRLEIIETLFGSVEKLWSRGECNQCFDVDKNGSISSELNNSTKTFQLMNSRVKICVQENMHNKDICIKCRDLYEELNNFYNNLKRAVSPADVCMDIVDSMNASRMEWSKDLGCRDHPGIDVPLIVTACFMFVIAFLFYIALWKFSSLSQRILDSGGLSILLLGMCEEEW